MADIDFEFDMLNAEEELIDWMEQDW